MQREARQDKDIASDAIGRALLAIVEGMEEIRGEIPYTDILEAPAESERDLLRRVAENEGSAEFLELGKVLVQLESMRAHNRNYFEQPS